MDSTSKLYDTYNEVPYLYWYRTDKLEHSDYMNFTLATVGYAGFLLEPAQEVIERRKLEFKAYGDYGWFKEFIKR